MLKPLEVLKLYPPHDYSLCSAYESRMEAARERPFVVCKGKSWSRQAFREAYLAAARLLTARGIRKGDRPERASRIVNPRERRRA